MLDWLCSQHTAMCYIKMSKIPAILSVILLSGPLPAQESPKPFVTYPGPVGDYLKRIQQGRQAHSFDASVRFGQWQEKARGALIELTGLQQMEKDLGGFTPKIRLGQAEKTNEPFTRALCSIETEPGVVIPFYLLIPKDANPAQPLPLLLCPHGHDKLGLHSYAGAFKDEKHRKTVLEKEGDIGAQAARRGFVVIAPATRGLAEELLVPDPKGRHGNRPCRAQLIHCLLAGRTPIAERVWDMQRLLDWAEKHPLVDRTRIVDDRQFWWRRPHRLHSRDRHANPRGDSKLLIHLGDECGRVYLSLRLLPRSQTPGLGRLERAGRPRRPAAPLDRARSGRQFAPSTDCGKAGSQHRENFPSRRCPQPHRPEMG